MPPRCTQAVASMAPTRREGMSLLLSGLQTLQLGSVSPSSATVTGCRQFHQHIRRPLLSSSSSSFLTMSSSSSPPSSSSSSSSSAPFSTSAVRPSRAVRRKMRTYLKTSFTVAKKKDLLRLTSSSNHSDNKEGPEIKRRYVFPGNNRFQSQSVLGENTRELIWERVVVGGEPVKAVAVELSIDMRRVAAVVRLKQIEKQWTAQGKRLAKPYARAVLSMIRQTDYTHGQPVAPHEPINELHVHGYTMQQLFLPVPESRHFTRADAAKAFHRDLLPADKRVPIPELIQLEKDVINGTLSPQKSFEAFTARAAHEAEQRKRQKLKQLALEEKNTVRAETDRFEFRIRSINSDKVGKGGRASKAVGHRYGMPFTDRRRGEVKIPTKVD